MKLLPTIRETIVGQVEKDNLHYDMLYKFLGIGDNDDLPDYEWVQDYEEDKAYWKDNDHISVEMLQEAVDEMKAMGATHVQIYSHGDHGSYYFTGVKLEVMDVEAVKKRKQAELEKALMHTTIRIKHEEDELKTHREHLEDLNTELGELK